MQALWSLRLSVPDRIYMARPRARLRPAPLEQVGRGFRRRLGQGRRLGGRRPGGRADPAAEANVRLRRRGGLADQPSARSRCAAC